MRRNEVAAVFAAVLLTYCAVIQLNDPGVVESTIVDVDPRPAALEDSGFAEAAIVNVDPGFATLKDPDVAEAASANVDPGFAATTPNLRGSVASGTPAGAGAVVFQDLKAVGLRFDMRMLFKMGGDGYSKFQPGSLYIDVGANNCMEHTKMAYMAGAKVIAFEPTKWGFAECQANFRKQKILHTAIDVTPGETPSLDIPDDNKPHVYLLRAGVGDTTASLNVFEPHKSSFQNAATKMAEIQVPGAICKDKTNGCDEVPVAIVRLDDLVQRDVLAVKLDCQGCELKALLGAAKLFSEHRVSFVEAEFEPFMPRRLGPEAYGAPDFNGALDEMSASLIEHLHALHFACFATHDTPMLPGATAARPVDARRFSEFMIEKRFPEDVLCFNVNTGA